MSLLKQIFSWCVAGLLLYGIYLAADESGYISHSVESTVTARQDWLVGETKECFSPVLDWNTALRIGKKTGNSTTSFHCDDGPEHIINVTFFGNPLQPEHKVALWRCKRETDGFTCHQTGAE
jgi:hypothetical protein